MKLKPHPIRAKHEAQWRYFADQYEGGPDYCTRANPLAIPIPLIPGQSGNSGANNYLIQQGLESDRNYAIRLNETPCIPLCSQVVDFYASTIGKQGGILIEPGNLDVFIDDCDLQGQSLTQFLANVRVHAAIYGHSFVVADMLRSTDAIVTQADVQRAGLRPYVYEVLPTEMLNWRFGPDGKLIEAVYQMQPMEAGGVLEDAQPETQTSTEYLYWSTSEWKRLKKTGEKIEEIDGGANPLGAVPITAVYHKRIHAWFGESMLKDAAHMQHTAVNWLSDMLQNLRMTMFAQPVLKTNRTLDQVAIGSAALLVLDGEGKEDFAYVTPDAQPFAEAWNAFYRFCDLARAAMGFTSASADKQPAVESGVSKAWDFFEAEKIMARMAENEQEAVKSILDFAGRWTGQPYTGNVQYATTYDLSTPSDDMETLLTMQAAQVPTEAQKEIMRRALSKLLPSMAPETQRAIAAQIDAWRTAEPAMPPVDKGKAE
jgi:hypothetical protein